MQRFRFPVKLCQFRFHLQCSIILLQVDVECLRFSNFHLIPIFEKWEREAYHYTVERYACFCIPAVAEFQFRQPLRLVDGDLLAVHKTQDVRNGQVVVARIDDEVTVKRLKKQGNTVQLLPENNEFSPIVVDLREHNFSIEGLAVGVIRNGEWL